MRLLSDMRVVDVREKSGVYVLSADNARRYLHNAGAKIDVFAKRQQMKELLEQQERVSRQLAGCAAASLTMPRSRYRRTIPCPTMSAAFRRTGAASAKISAIFISGRRPARRSSPSGAAPPVSCPRPRRGAVRRRRGHFVGTDNAREAVSRFFRSTEIKAGASAGQERSTQNEP